MIRIISEIGINHNGNFHWINELIRQSKLGGADYAKFQLYTSQLIWGDDSRKHNEFTFNQVAQIRDMCEMHDIRFLVTVNDREKLEWGEKLDLTEYKVSSLILKRDKAFVQEVVSTGKPVYVSLGMWDEVDLPFSEENVCYFYCRSAYPTYWNDMPGFPARFDGKPFTGYSDHTHGLGASLLAIARGATLIEKHFTLSKAAPGNDHIGSMDLAELTTLSQYGREIGNARAAIER